MQIPIEELPLGVRRSVDGDFSVASERLGTSLSSAAWSIEEGTSVTLSGVDTITDNISNQFFETSATITGCTLLKCKGTFANTEEDVKFIKIDVIDPTC